MLPRVSSLLSKTLAKCSTNTLKYLTRVAVCNNEIEVTGAEGTVKYNKKWLRDHCREEGRYHYDSHQRALDIPDVGLGNNIAAAEVKPLITGFDKKLTKKPSLKTPKDNCISPIIKANSIAAAM